MDAICGTGFGVEVDSQRNPDNPFIKYAKQFLEVDMAGNPVLLFSRKKSSLSDAFAYIIFSRHFLHNYLAKPVRNLGPKAIKIFHAHLS